MKRKLSLAMAIVTEPKLIILDEPTSGLDAFQAQQVAAVAVPRDAILVRLAPGQRA